MAICIVSHIENSKKW